MRVTPATRRAGAPASRSRRVAPVAGSARVESVRVAPVDGSARVGSARVGSARVGSARVASVEGSTLATQFDDPAARVARPRAPAPAPGGALERHRVADIQRVRILTAMAELVREQGVRAVTVAHVVARSGVSRRTFYELFEDREDCLLAVFEHALARASAAVLAAYTAPDDRWEQQVRAGLRALLELIDAEPVMGGLCIVDALAAEQAVLERRARVIAALVETVHRGGVRARRTVGRDDLDGDDGRPPARIVAEGVVGAVLAIVHARLLERDRKPLGALLNQLVGIVVLPYLGPAAARRELERSVPRARRPAPAPANPLRGLDMRLTYRTVRVLLAIAERPAASGRQIATASGIQDQGQMSKLLARMAHLGLIHNATTARGRGEPNAWHLTDRGRELEQAIRAQTQADG